jgi:putative oxidoreductase
MVLDIALLTLRAGLGATFLASSWPKVKGNMGGFMTFIGVCELLGAIAVLVGFLTQLASIGLAVIMLGAIYTHIFKWHTGFKGKNGWEVAFLLLTLAVGLALMGAGQYSVDLALGLPGFGR